MRKISALLILIFLPACAAHAGATPEQIEFFEKRIRPVLAQECYECHSSTTKAKGGLVLDSRPGWMEGGQSGEVLIAGDPTKSLLIQSIRHSDPELKMPKNGAKLDESTLKDFETWVKMGAPDPRDKPSPPAEIEADTAWPSILERRKEWWSFKKPKESPVPSVNNGAWSELPIDRYLLSKMEAEGLAPTKDADPRTLLRRLNFVITGLPPTAEEIEDFASAAGKNYAGAIASTTERLLASPRYGERWGRHWLDWMRYAETHGSEGDPAIPFAWRYRDYVIRALNADVPYPQMVKEHIAGDLLPNPRIDSEKGINESALGAAQYRMVLHGFTPTDAHDEQVTFIDNQIDTISKAFMGVTVSCARCHNHKFDAISQADFYAFYGILADCRPATIDANLPERQRLNIPQLSNAKEALKKTLAELWLQKADDAVSALRTHKVDPKMAAPFTAWAKLSAMPAEKWAAEWTRAKDELAENRKKLAAFRAQESLAKWDFTRGESAAWRSDGPGLRSTGPGEFHVDAQGDRVIAGIYPAGVYSHLLSSKHRGVLSSPNFKAQGGKLWVRARGANKARIRYVVRNYPRTGIIYPKHELNKDEDEWVQWSLDYWSGDTIHVEITTDMDQPVEQSNSERSWFGVSELFYAKDGNAPAPPLPLATLAAVMTEDAAAPANLDELRTLYADALRRCITAWREGAMTDAQAEFLAAFVRKGWLPNQLKTLPPEVAAQVSAYRALEAAVPVPTRVPGVLEGFHADRPLFNRGDHKKPMELVARRFLDAVDPTPYQTQGQSGRLQLAESLVAPTNPLYARVLVNRAWQYVFGQGLVGTPDNFGRLGEAPSHPELLDYLALEFQKNGGSLKKLIQMMVTARAFRLDSRPSPDALAKDGANRWRSYYAMARLDAEAIRDNMLFLSGKMDLNVGGPAVDGSAPRRSVYVKVVRNNLDPLMSAFDYPVPFATRGKRDVTNVPAQALTLLNSPLANNWARDWAKRVLADKRFSNDEQRLTRMYMDAFSRLPRESELRECQAYLDSVAADQKADAAWESLAQALFNAKEFIYVR